MKIKAPTLIIIFVILLIAGALFQYYESQKLTEEVSPPQTVVETPPENKDPNLPQTFKVKEPGEASMAIVYVDDIELNSVVPMDGKEEHYQITLAKAVDKFIIPSATYYKIKQHQYSDKRVVYLVFNNQITKDNPNIVNRCLRYIIVEKKYYTIENWKPEDNCKYMAKEDALVGAK